MPPPELEPTITERDFVFSTLPEGLRVDGRGMMDMRELEIRFGEELGWCEVRLGEGRVIAQVSASIVPPREDRPYEGFLILHTEVSPMAGPGFEAGRASEEEVLITRLLEKALRRSDAVDREALCIVAGQKVWQIRVDVHFLSHEGNLVDPACIAAITALHHFRRPDVTVIGDEVEVHSIEERVPVPLAIHHTPVCVTFAFFDDGPHTIIDPTALELALSSSTLTLTLNAQKEICALTKAGGAPLEPDEILRVMNIAVGRVREISTSIKKALEEDAKERVIEVR